jgi:hypothetical protein
MDKDYCLKSIKIPSKLLVTNVQKDFSDRIHEIMRYPRGIFEMKYG